MILIKVNLKYKEDINMRNDLYIVNDENMVKIIGAFMEYSSSNITIKIWNFHTGILLNKIDANQFFINTCLWENRYLITLNVGFINNYLRRRYHSISFIDLKECKEEYNFILEYYNYNDLKFIEIFEHPDYGKCLLTIDNNKAFKLLIQNKK